MSLEIRYKVIVFGKVSAWAMPYIKGVGGNDNLKERTNV